MREIPSTANGDFLVVDDNINNLKTIEQLLKDAGHQVRCATNGRTALMLAAARRPELMLLDVRMPVMTGYELCAKFKADPTFQDIPVIFLSAAGELQDKLAGFKAGGVDYILKPFDVEEVLIRIQTHLKLHRLQVALTHAYAEVERQVQERTRELQSALGALQQSEQNYREIFNSTSDALFIHDASGQILDVNERTCTLFGCERTALLPMAVNKFSLGEPPYSQAEAEQHVRLAIEQSPHVFEWRSRRLNGEVFWTEVALRACEIAGQKRIIASVRDISGRKQMEAKLREMQKMESIGQLAGGVAHDFNNILAAMMMQLNLLQDDKNLNQETQESLRELMTGAKRAASLTQQLLMFGRRSILNVKVLDVNEIVANLLKMLGRLIGEDINLVFEPGANLPVVEADAGMLEQVLMNLAVNARDAMPTGGHLLIKTTSIENDPARARTNPDSQSGTYVCLTIADTGCGMDETTRKRIFEPFFTTKEVGKGTGLGLATVYGILAQHKGWIDVESHAGSGTTFRVFLPASGKQVAASTDEVSIKDLRGHETILVVEDEATVRRTLVLSLKKYGYQVFEAENGQKAISLWQTHREKIDLLLSDMVMPEGLTGLALAEQLRAAKPTLKVIISSGYSEAIKRGIHDGKAILYLPKPYQIPELAKILRECFKPSQPDAAETKRKDI